jgi:hypothetical protein
MQTSFIRIFLTFLFCSSSLFSLAQSGTQTSISIGTELGIPFNAQHDYVKTRDVYQDGLGGIIRLELPITSSLHFIASAGYAVYHSNLMYLYAIPDVIPGSNPNLPNQPGPYTYIPLKAGLRYYYVKYLYVSAEAGEAIKTNKFTRSSFIYSGGLGGAIPISAHHGIDIGLRYEGGYKNTDADFRMSQLGVGVAYKYSF